MTTIGERLKHQSAGVGYGFAAMFALAGNRWDGDEFLKGGAGLALMGICQIALAVADRIRHGKQVKP